MAKRKIFDEDITLSDTSKFVVSDGLPNGFLRELIGAQAVLTFIRVEQASWANAINSAGGTPPSTVIKISGRFQKAIDSCLDAALKFEAATDSREAKSRLEKELSNYSMRRLLAADSTLGKDIISIAQKKFYYFSGVLGGIVNYNPHDLFLDIPIPAQAELLAGYFAGTRYQTGDWGDHGATLISRMRSVERELDELDDRVSTARQSFENSMTEGRANRDTIMNQFERDASSLGRRLDDAGVRLETFKEDLGAIQSQITAEAISAKETIGNLIDNLNSEVRDALSSHEEQIGRIRNAFTADMNLKASETYWLDKLKKHDERANNFWALFLVMGIGGAIILTTIAAQMMSYFSSADFSTQARALLILTIPAGALLWTMRLISRQVVSNRALSDDAMERIAMIKTFKALEIENGANPDERHIALSVIFRPAGAPVEDNSSATLAEAAVKIIEKLSPK